MHILFDLCQCQVKLRLLNNELVFQNNRNFFTDFGDRSEDFQKFALSIHDVLKINFVERYSASFKTKLKLKLEHRINDSISLK